MAKVIWGENAERLYLEHLEYARLEFGNTTVKRWHYERKQIEWRLERYPTSYSPESSLSHLTLLYRSCHMMRRRFKLIFFYDEAKDIVRIIDIWDTRMNPKVLVDRIK
jgi:hypothetical protein